MKNVFSHSRSNFVLFRWVPNIKWQHLIFFLIIIGKIFPFTFIRIEILALGTRCNLGSEYKWELSFLVSVSECNLKIKYLIVSSVMRRAIPFSHAGSTSTRGMYRSRKTRETCIGIKVETRGQFHQCYTYKFFIQVLFWQLFL